MDVSSVQHQEMHSQSLENVLVCSKTQQDKKPRPPAEQALKCPRCESTNTKFCYYNNYSLTQPRYFCKGCRRYWTQGGTLRNVPVGGGCRKNKRSSSSSTKRIQDQPLTNPVGFQTLPYDSNDLSLAFARLQDKQAGGHFSFADHDHVTMLGHQNNAQCEVLGDVHTSPAGNSIFLDALRSGFFHNQNGYHHNMYNHGNIGEVENSGVSVGASGEMVMAYEDHMSTAATSNDVTGTITKQEMCNFPGENNNRMLWGFPWQINGEGNIGGDLASSWHGLVNTGPLM